MTRRDNPARRLVTTASVAVTVTSTDIAFARDRFRKHAPRRYWGLTDATPIKPTPVAPAT